MKRLQQSKKVRQNVTKADHQTQESVCDESLTDSSLQQLRHAFPMFDDDLLSEQLKKFGNDRGKAQRSLSKLCTKKGIRLEPADVPIQQPEAQRGPARKLIANVIARTDHPNLPLYCFIAMITRSTQSYEALGMKSQKYALGSIVRPIPVDRFRLLGDEKGHFWLKKKRVPDIGDIVEISFFEEDTMEYARSVHGASPHQKEDLLCTKLSLHHRCELGRNDFLASSLMSASVDDLHVKWPWKAALGKFESVTPGKNIWFVHPKKSLPSVIILRLKRPDLVHFKYRGATNDRISVDFPAGRKRILRDIPVTAAGFDFSPCELNSWVSEICAETEQLLVLGLARAECRCPLGFNRLEELPDRLRRQVDVEELEKYCQILLIGVLPCRKSKQDTIRSRWSKGAFAKLPLEACKVSGTVTSRTLAPRASRLRRPGKHGPRQLQSLG